MALGIRTVSISLRFPTAQTSAQVSFFPDFAAGDGQVLVEETYTATITGGAPSTTLTGSINLPVKSSGYIGYRVKFPRETGFNEHYIYLETGVSTVELSDLLNLAAVVGVDLTLGDLSDVTLTSPANGEYLKYNGTNWINSPVTFTSITFDDAYITTTSIGVIGPTADQAIMSLSATLYRSVKYIVQAVCGSDVHVTEIRVFHDGSTCSIMEYGTAFTTNLASFSADITGGNIRLLTTPTQSGSTTTYKVIAQAIEV